MIKLVPLNQTEREAILKMIHYAQLAEKAVMFRKHWKTLSKLADKMLDNLE